MRSAIEVEDLVRDYGKTRAVDHVSFTVGSGEVFGFLGPNGAGKTTTIRMLTGLTRPDEGGGTVAGFDLTREMPRIKKAIGVVPEASNLYDELSALDNLVFAGQLYGVPRAERKPRAEELLRQFGLAERRRSPFGSFSKGMKRALTIAAALIHRPRIVFLDEPTSGLDVLAARRLRATIRSLRESGVTVFLTTHYLEEADLLCDHLAIIVKGRIVARGSPEELKAMANGEPALEVSFDRAPIEVPAEGSLPSGVARIERLGDRLRLHGSDLGALTRLALDWAEAGGVKVTGLGTAQPSLEEAFVRLTGLARETMLAEKGERKSAGG